MNAWRPPAAVKRGWRKVSISRRDVCTCQFEQRHCLISSGPFPAMLSITCANSLVSLLRFSGLPAEPGPPSRSGQHTAACSSRAFCRAGVTCRMPYGTRAARGGVGWDLRIIGYVRHVVWHQTKVLSKQRVLGHDAQLPAITYNHFGTYIHMYHGSGNDFTDLRIYPPPSPSSRLGPRHGPPNQVTAGMPGAAHVLPSAALFFTLQRCDIESSAASRWVN